MEAKEFIQMVANLTKDGECSTHKEQCTCDLNYCECDAECTPFLMENDDAVNSLNNLIRLARSIQN